MADRALRIEKEKLRSANVTIEDCQDKIRCLTQERDYARTHQKIVEIPVEKPVLYEKCEACDRAAYQNAKTKYETQKERLAGQYKAKTVMFQTTLFLLAWYSLISTLFQAIQSDAFLSDCKSFFNDLASFIPVSYTHLDVYKRQTLACLITLSNTIITPLELLVKKFLLTFRYRLSMICL